MPLQIRSAQAELDASTVTSLSMVAMAFAVTNTASSAADCVCMAAESTCPTYPWAMCAMIGLTVAGLVASIAQKKKNSDSADHFRGDGSTSGTNSGTNSTLGTNSDLAGGDGGTLPGGGDPAPLDYKAFCSKTPEFCNDCAKGGDFSKCQPKLQLPSDFPLEAASKMPELAEAISAMNEAMDYINTNSDPSLVGASGESGFAQSGEGGGGGDPTYIKKKGVGRQDGDGLGRAGIWGMDMVDEKTGAKLTLWQRATRRYYGVPDLKRLGFLARAEYVRAKAMQHAIANANKAAAAPVAPRVGQQSAVPSVTAPVRDPRIPSSDKSSTLAAPVVPTKY